MMQAERSERSEPGDHTLNSEVAENILETSLLKSLQKSTPKNIYGMPLFEKLVKFRIEFEIQTQMNSKQKRKRINKRKGGVQPTWAESNPQPTAAAAAAALRENGPSPVARTPTPNAAKKMGVRRLGFEPRPCRLTPHPLATALPLGCC